MSEFRNSILARLNAERSAKESIVEAAQKTHEESLAKASLDDAALSDGDYFDKYPSHKCRVRRPTPKEAEGLENPAQYSVLIGRMDPETDPKLGSAVLMQHEGEMDYASLNRDQTTLVNDFGETPEGKHQAEQMRGVIDGLIETYTSNSDKPIYEVDE